MRSAGIVCCLCLIVVAPLSGVAQETDDRTVPPPTPYERVSGFIDNTSTEAWTAHDEPITIPGAAWLRVYFGEATSLDGGSFIRITSELDGEVQELDAAALEMWHHASGYFNGDSVRVEMVVGPGTAANHMEINAVAYEEAPDVPESLCGADDRVPSYQLFAGRVQPNFCSAAIWNEASCLLSAGHCFDQPSDGQVIEFNVPQNNAACQPQHPPIADQFPILDRQFLDGGIGNDWAVATTGTNNLGETIVERYGEYRPVALSIPGVGSSMAIWGYGSDTQCLWSYVQQASFGTITVLTATTVQHNADTTGGNSGSGVLHDDTIIAAHTHAGCPQNRSTRVDLASFALARANMCISEAGFVRLDGEEYGCGSPIAIRMEDRSLIGAGTQEVTLTSESEPDGETLALSEAFAAVYGGTYQLTDQLPAVSGDGLLSAVHGDTVTVTYIDADPGDGTLMVPRTATATVDCVGPSISNVQANSIGPFSATIEWSTDEASTSTVNLFGPGGETNITDDTPVVLHGVQLEGLAECTAYSFSVASEDSLGNTTTDDNSGALYSFETQCLTPAPVPDGSDGTQPVTARHVSGNTIEVSWDGRCPSPGSIKIIYGNLDQVADYTLLGATCGIASDATSTMFTSFSLGSIWFVVVRDNIIGEEGSWGHGTAGERNGNTASGQCGALIKDLTGTCP